MVALATAIPASARAHGTFPEVEQLALAPSDPSLLVAQTSFGLAVSRDGGASWGWVCSQVFAALETEDPRVLVGTDGAIVVGVFAGLFRGERAGCAWSVPAGAPDGEVVIDLDRDATDPSRVYAITSSGGRPNGLYRSVDGGAAWSAVGDPIDTVLFESVRVAPSEPSRLYAIGATSGAAREIRMYRSDDGGTSWRSWTFVPPVAARNARLLGVSPADPDVLFARALADAGVPETLLRSDDGGASWAEVSRFDAVTAVAFSAPGTTWIAARAEGLWRSDEGRSPVRVEGVSDVRCVLVRAGELWVCANEFVDGFAIGRSADGGATFEPVMHVQAVTATIACDPGDSTSIECVAREDWLRSVTQVGRTTASGCSVGRGRAPMGPAIMMLAAAVVCAMRRLGPRTRTRLRDRTQCR